MKFKCMHCGQCCENEATQINLTLGDIFRISKLTGLSVKELFKGYVGFNPFGDPNNTNLYDVEIGLNIPCKFRKDQKCTIYKARPLNCRLFPYWILAKAPVDKINEYVDPDCKCFGTFKFNKKHRNNYKKYVKEISKEFQKENKLTEDFYKKIELNLTIDISNLKDYKELMRILTNGEVNMKDIDKQKIKFCKEYLKNKDFSQQIDLVEKEINKHKKTFKNHDFFVEKDKLINSQ